MHIITEKIWSHWWVVRRRPWHPTPVLLPGKSHGQRNLVGCSPWGREESDTTERFHFHVSLSCIGEGNGNPLRCSCLENPRDVGAWWAAIYGVTQSRTRLKQLSSSSRWVLSMRKMWFGHIKKKQNQKTLWHGTWWRWKGTVIIQVRIWWPGLG